MENLGKMLKQIREERGLTQEQFAELVGWKQSTLSIYETGRRRLKVDTLEKIIKPLGMRPIVTIVYDEGDK